MLFAGPPARLAVQDWNLVMVSSCRENPVSRRIMLTDENRDLEIVGGSVIQVPSPLGFVQSVHEIAVQIHAYPSQTWPRKPSSSQSFKIGAFSSRCRFMMATFFAGE